MAKMLLETRRNIGEELSKRDWDKISSIPSRLVVYMEDLTVAHGRWFVVYNAKTNQFHIAIALKASPTESNEALDKFLSDQENIHRLISIVVFAIAKMSNTDILFRRIDGADNWRLAPSNNRERRYQSFENYINIFC